MDQEVETCIGGTICAGYASLRAQVDEIPELLTIAHMQGAEHAKDQVRALQARIDDLSRAYAVQGLALEDFQTRVKELEALVSTLEVQAVNSIEPGWVMIPAVEWRQAWDRFNH